MTVSRDVINTAVRIIGDIPGGRTKLGYRRGVIGTGFLLAVQSETIPEIHYAYAITAHHVIHEQNKIEAQAPNPFGGGELYEPMVLTDWIQPIKNLDLAVAPLPQQGQAFQLLSLEQQVLRPEFSPPLGANVYYVGILDPLDRPMVRSGTIGAVDQVGIKHATEWEVEYDYISHVIDCRSYDGFSGSPCFFEQAFAVLKPLRLDPARPEGFASPPDPLGEIAYRIRLCGMFTEYVELKKPSADRSRIGVGIMLRSNEIWEALMTGDMKIQRTKWDEAQDEDDPDQTGLRLASAADRTSAEYERFEDLARQIVQVPKEEVDEKRKET